MTNGNLSCVPRAAGDDAGADTERPPQRVHELKTWPEPFQAVVDGRKRYEVRKDDRGYAVGDELVLREWDPAKDMERPFSADKLDRRAYSGRALRARVTYITHGGRFGVPPGLAVMSIEVLERCDGLPDVFFHDRQVGT